MSINVRMDDPQLELTFREQVIEVIADGLRI